MICAAQLQDDLDQPSNGTVPAALCAAHDENRGRTWAYENPELIAEAVRAFLERFGRFLSEDARQDFWIRSHGDAATIVFDRHNLIYAYGPLDAFESVLRGLGVKAGAPASTPDPHVHHYHAERDDDERAVLQAFDWHVKPLRESDVQFVAKSS